MTTRNGEASAVVDPANNTNAIAIERMVGVCRIRGYILARKFPCGYPEGSVRIRLSRRGLGALPARRAIGRSGPLRARAQPRRRASAAARSVSVAHVLAAHLQRLASLLL